MRRDHENLVPMKRCSHVASGRVSLNHADVLRRVHGLNSVAGLGPIRFPERSEPGAEESIAGVDLADGAVATSGDYERFIEIEGERYCHILNAQTGWPVRCWQSVSVVAPLCVVAGSCATIAMLPEDDAEAFLEAQGVNYLAIASDDGMRGSAGTTPIAIGKRCQAPRTPGA